MGLAENCGKTGMSNCGTGYPSGDTGVYTLCFGLYFGNLGYSGGRAIIMFWTLTIRDAPAGGLFIFFWDVLKGYPCGDTGVLYVIFN